jgi:hypothetical protein
MSSFDCSLPDWVAPWCRSELGVAPTEALFAASVVSEVIAVRLEDGREVVIKARPDENGRAAKCVAVQRAVADGGFPCSRPLTSVSSIEALVVHAEEWRPGGEMMRDDSERAAALSARLLADLMARLGQAVADPPLPNPVWVRWDHDDPGLFPANPRLDAGDLGTKLPDYVADTALRVRAALSRSTLSRVVGHADWEAQNLPWVGADPYAVHDWDSLAWLPEAAIVGAASGAFASMEIPTLAPLESSAAFIDSYQEATQSLFEPEERRVAWGASLWPALFNARREVAFGHEPLAASALAEQAEERLLRAQM